LGEMRLPIGQRHLYATDAVHDMMIGYDVTTFINDDAGPHAVHTTRRFTWRRNVVSAGDRLLAMDIDDRRAALLNGSDDGIAAQFRSVGSGSQCRGRQDHQGCPSPTVD